MFKNLSNKTIMSYEKIIFMWNSEEETLQRCFPWIGCQCLEMLQYEGIFSLLVNGTCKSKEFHKSVHQANNKIPQISGQLGPGNENSPKCNQQNSVETVADISQSVKKKQKKF